MKQITNHQFTRTYGITVTYGSRFRLLRNVVVGAIANGVEKLIIVDNGCEDTCRKEIHRLKYNLKRQLIILTLPQNQGSAAGYKAGLEHVLGCSDCEYIWLLDDDNQPSETALSQLFRYYRKLNHVVAPDRLVLLSLREDLDFLKKVALGVPPAKAYPRKSSFLWFHVLDLPKSILKYFRSDRMLNSNQTIKSPTPIPYAPYGGLFFHKSALSRLGFPDERFFVYSDDTEYTYRFTKSGGRLFLVPSSIVFDRDSIWYYKTKGKTLFSRLLLADSDFRVHYGIRNRSYFAGRFWKRSNIVYDINKWTFLAMLFFFALRYRKLKRFVMIVRAARQGERGDLGFLKDIGNP